MFEGVGSMNRMVQAVNILAEAEAKVKEAEQLRDMTISEATKAKMAREEA